MASPTAGGDCVLGLDRVDHFLFLGNESQGSLQVDGPERKNPDDPAPAREGAVVSLTSTELWAEATPSPAELGPLDSAPAGIDLSREMEWLHSAETATFETLSFARDGNRGGSGGDSVQGEGAGSGGDGGGGKVLSSYTSGKGTSDFNIKIAFRGSWTSELQEAFIQASDLISDIIKGDIPNVKIGRMNIDDVVIYASLADIDGSGGVLGQAGPTAIRTSGFLPAKAMMTFDIADAKALDASNSLNDVAFHEMMHSIGFGTIWDLLGLVDGSIPGQLRFNGAQATAEYEDEFRYLNDPNAWAGVPVETNGGPGTAGGHWNEKGPDGPGLKNEIMTGYLDKSGNYLSDTTVATLADLGYGTVYEPGTDVVATLDTSIFDDHDQLA